MKIIKLFPVFSLCLINACSTVSPKLRSVASQISNQNPVNTLGLEKFEGVWASNDKRAFAIKLFHVKRDLDAGDRLFKLQELASLQKKQPGHFNEDVLRIIDSVDFAQLESKKKNRSLEESDVPLLPEMATLEFALVNLGTGLGATELLPFRDGGDFIKFSMGMNIDFKDSKTAMVTFAEGRSPEPVEFTKTNCDYYDWVFIKIGVRDFNTPSFEHMGIPPKHIDIDDAEEEALEGTLKMCLPK